MSKAEVQAVQSSIEDVWYLKEIKFNGNGYRIITQNFNGPCSFIAICNILILRGDIEVLPPTRRTVSYEFLSQIVADYLLKTSPDVDVSSALSVMPLTQKGMDLNPVFTSSTTFHPTGSIGGGGELNLFKHVGIPLVHGWLVDPESRDADVLTRINDYDAAVELIAEVDHLTNGKFVVTEAEDMYSAGPSSSNWKGEDVGKIEDAIVIRRFLDASQSQLTYHGLFHLASSLPSNTLCALFRNSHLSVLYKYVPNPPPPETLSSDPALTRDEETASSTIEPPSEQAGSPQPEHDTNAALYSLVSDQVFLRERDVVWERLEDVDGGLSTFVDSDFVKSSPAGGDFAGQTAEEALRAAEAGNHTAVDSHDFALARQLQAEEDQYARQAYRKQQIALREKEEQRKKQAKKKDCVIM